ncbi:hypothetical protein GH714_022678 [Hevea brasiliensis]|uniref:Uncharacterized protein n=1 Tax=Hevea brasiliensis TaxID=3981 RepID=A0A6A6M2W6_HEVBR|nr:hypothetical protein GH714_022678 [Hevea brasiliensis]
MEKLDKLLEEQIERRDKLFQEAQSKSQFQDLELKSQIPGGFTENGKKTENVAAFTNDALELCLAQGGKTLQHLEQDFLPHMSSISEVFGEENGEDIKDNNHGTEVYWVDDNELGKTKESVAKKEIVLLDDKIHGDGDGFENDNITEASSKVHMRQLDYSMGRIGAEYEVEFLCSITQRMILPQFRMEEVLEAALSRVQKPEISGSNGNGWSLLIQENHDREFYYC